MTNTYRARVDPQGRCNIESNRLAVMNHLAVVILHLVVVGHQCWFTADACVSIKR